MEITNNNSQPSNPVYSGMKRAEAAKEVLPKATNADNDVDMARSQVKDLSKSEQQRLETVLQGSKMFRNFYAVSDTRFTILKMVAVSLLHALPSLMTIPSHIFPNPILPVLWSVMLASVQPYLSSKLK